MAVAVLCVKNQRDIDAGEAVSKARDKLLADGHDATAVGLALITAGAGLLAGNHSAGHRLVAIDDEIANALEET